MSPELSILGDTVVRRATFGSPFSRESYMINVRDVPTWIIGAGNEMAGKVADYLGTKPNPSGYGLSHLVRTAAYAFLLGGKYYGMGKNRAALLLAGLVHDVEKDHPHELAESIGTVRPWITGLQGRYFQVALITEGVLDLVALHDLYKAAIESGDRERAEVRRLGGKGYPRTEHLGRIFTQLPRPRQGRFLYEGHDAKDTDSERARFLRLMERLTTADIFDRTDKDRWIVAAYQILQKQGEPGYQREDARLARDQRVLTGLGNRKWFDVRDPELAMFDQLVEGVVETTHKTRQISAEELQKLYESSREKIRERDEAALELVRRGDIIRPALEEILQYG